MAYARHSSNNRRPRNNSRGGNHNHNRNNNSGGGGNNRRPQARLNHVYDSNGPEGRVRGTAAQIVDKYTSLARDANVSGNKVLQQSFLQHAEHYQRILIEVQKEVAQTNERRAEQQAEQKNNQASKVETKPEESNKQNTTKPEAKADEAKAKTLEVKTADDDKMTDVPGFLAGSDDEGKKETKPRGRKPKADKEQEKTETLEKEPA